MNPNKPLDQFEDGGVVEPQSVGERLGGAFAFVWFRQRMIIGAILILGLIYGIYKVYTIPPKTFDDGPTLVVNDYLKDLPMANINFKPLLDESKTGEDTKPKIRTMDDIELPEEKVIVPYDPLIDEGTVDELIEAALDLRDSWARQTAPVAYLQCQRRARITRRLMELELNEDQQAYALGDYIESLILLDKLVAEAKFYEPQIRVAINEIVEKYSDHPHPIVRAKANLAAVLAPIHDFLNTNETQKLEEFANQIPERFKYIIADPSAATRLAGMTLRMHKHRNWDGSALPYCMEVVTRMEAVKDPEIKEIGIGLRERLYFEHLEPNELVGRIGLGDFETRDTVRKYFAALEQNPNSRMPFFQVAVSTIEAFKLRDQKEDYEALVAWLLRISATVQTETIRVEIEKAIEKLEGLPFGGNTAVEEDPTKIGSTN